MYRGYNLDLFKSDKQAFLEVTGNEIDEYEKSIIELKKSLKTKMTDQISLPRDTIGNIDGGKIIKDWFPGYKADVLISHSHNDARTAKRIAVWLKKEFGLTTFIDSIVWGSADMLLQEIDNQYSVLSKKDGKTTYNYHIRNFTTSHVHMMLSTALNDIIDQTECLIFLNTPQSLNINEATSKKTNSPWIYNELKTAAIIRKVHPRQKIVKELIERRSYMLSETQNSLEILYPVDGQLRGLESLDVDKLQEWLKNYNKFEKNDIHALDILYFTKNEIRWW